MNLLTSKEMNKVNFLITEISFELLGNKFYDIFGQEQNSLGSLINAKAKPSINYDEDNCSILKVLSLNKNGSSDNDEDQGMDMDGCELVLSTDEEEVDNSKNVQDIPSVSAETSKIPERRASNDGINVVKVSPKRIRARRNTVYVENEDAEARRRNYNREYYQNKRKIAAENQPSTSTKKITNRRSSVYNPDSHAESNDMDIKGLVTRVNLGTQRLQMQSEKSKLEHFTNNKHRMVDEYMDEYEIVQEFHEKEQEQLMVESNVLVELIKFIKGDPKNDSTELSKMTSKIFELKQALDGTNTNFTEKQIHNPTL